MRSRAAATFVVGDATALFCERTQRLSALNDTAWRIWRTLDGGGSCADAAADLEALGAAPDDARAFVESAATQWLQAGYFAPQDILDLVAGAPRSVLQYLAAQLSFALRCFDAVPAAAASAFAALSRPSGEPDATFDLVGRGEFVFLFLGDSALGMFSRDEIAAALKAQVTEQLCRSITDGFLTHAGLVAANGRRILLSGAPGAGKTTLTLALSGSGFAYGGDDIVHVRADGSAVGVPFSAAAKEGAWPLLEAYCPQLSDLPVCPRADGKVTRYVTPAILDHDGPRPIDVVLLLVREPGVKARLEPVAALDAVCVLLDSSFSQRGSLRAEALQAFAASIAKADCRRLVYESLDAAVSAVRELANE